jgi:hypothetical protein
LSASMSTASLAVFSLAMRTRYLKSWITSRRDQ